MRIDIYHHLVPDTKVDELIDLVNVMSGRFDELRHAIESALSGAVHRLTEQNDALSNTVERQQEP